MASSASTPAVTKNARSRDTSSDLGGLCAYLSSAEIGQISMMCCGQRGRHRVTCMMNQRSRLPGTVSGARKIAGPSIGPARNQHSCAPMRNDSRLFSIGSRISGSGNESGPSSM
ncbi:hypothetical protein BGV47_07275 [Burkholderia ubonensis]|nr:hypothetical protein BGV47_07275 [Burkholderia ubonensis]